MKSLYQGRDLTKSDTQVCARCIFDSSLCGIDFDDEGVCNYCRMVESLGELYGTGLERGEIEFKKIVASIKKHGHRKKYDVAVGVSGGTDSSYLLYLTKKYGLRPLAVHYDNTFNSAIATENIRRVTSAMNVDLYTHVCDNKESEDIFRSFFLASVPEIDGPTDIALAEVMFEAASKYGIRYVFEGHSFVAEGVAPMGMAYVDGGYINALHNRFGKMKMKTFPNMTFFKFLYWSIYKRIKKIRPLWYLSYSKEDAKQILKAEFGWVDYGGHHLENRMSAFHHSFYTPNKFGLDQRNNTLSALVRNGVMTRVDAFSEYAKPPFIEQELVEYIMKRFELTEKEFWYIMDLPQKLYTDYPTYKKRFERLRPLFYLLAKANLVPMSFYLKYCFPVKTSA